MEIISGVIHKPTKCVLYGPEGIGKSTFASQAPAPLFIDTEGSTVRMDVSRLPAPTSAAMIIAEINDVRDHPDCCRTLVLDTADWAEKMIRTAVCQRYNQSSLEGFGYGKGYTYVYEDFGRLLNALDEVADRGIHIVITAHAAMRKFEQPDENGAYDRWELKLINSQKCNICAMLKEWADMVLFANYETFVQKNEEKKVKAYGGKRIMYTSHHPCWDAKNRFGLPDKLPFEFTQVAHCFLDMGHPVTQTPPNTPAPAPVSSPALVQMTPPPVVEPVAPHAVQSASALVSTLNQPETIQEPTTGVPEYLAPLYDIMQADNVTAEEIEAACVAKGYMPQNVPLADYPEDFVTGCLIGAWAQVKSMILENRPLPF